MHAARMRFSVFVLVIVVLVSGALVAGCSWFEDENRSVVIFGDSLTATAHDYIELVASDEDQTIEVEAIPGIAMCDVVNEAERVIREDHPTAVLLAFVGNNTTPCVAGGSGNALADIYEQSARDIAQVAADEGVPLVLIGPPAMNRDRWTEDARLLNERYRAVADDMGGVDYVDLGETMSPNGFTLSLPCLESETSEQGCFDGQVRVRSFDGVHWDDPGSDGYSSGSFRFARVVVDTAKEHG